MVYNLQEVIAMLDFISEEYGKTIKNSAEKPTFDGFSKFLVEEIGIDDKFQIVDKAKWMKFMLSRP